MLLLHLSDLSPRHRCFSSNCSNALSFPKQWPENMWWWALTGSFSGHEETWRPLNHTWLTLWNHRHGVIIRPGGIIIFLPDIIYSAHTVTPDPHRNICMGFSDSILWNKPLWGCVCVCVSYVAWMQRTHFLAEQRYADKKWFPRSGL